MTPTPPTSRSQSIFGAANTIDRDKSIFLEAKLGGLVAQFHSVARGMSMLACHLLTAVESEFCWEYEEAVADTKHTCSLEVLLKRQWNTR